MAKQLLSASIAAPGFYGLNTQESSITLAAGFALQADNCVIDKYGRLGARKGWTYITQGNTGVDLKGAHEFIDINGTHTFGAWSDDGFYIVDGGDLIPVTYNGDNTLGEDVHWQAATLNDAAYLACEHHEMVYFSPTAGAIDDVQNVAANVNKFVPQPDTLLSAYGRLWAAGDTNNLAKLYWSDLLDGTVWEDGTAGELDLSAVLVNGNDKIVALGAHSGRLIIFCRDNIIIYGSNDNVIDPANMELIEVINNVGCVARDSVHNTGSDILFLSDSGVMSLGRLIQEKSQPMRDLSKNVRDDLVRDIIGTDTAEVKAVYSQQEAFYLLLIPEYKRIYCFDMRSALQDGSARVTVWDNQTHTNLYTTDDGLWFTNTDGMAKYNGYDDNGASYVMKYYTNYFDFGDATKFKYLKRVGITLIGGSGQDFVLKAGYDYDDSYRSFPLDVASQANAEYGVAEYNTTAEYTVGTLSDTVRAPMGGGGNVLQIGFEATINGAQLSIQKLDMYTKEGRTY